MSITQSNEKIRLYRSKKNCEGIGERVVDHVKSEFSHNVTFVMRVFIEQILSIQAIAEADKLSCRIYSLFYVFPESEITESNVCPRVTYLLNIVFYLPNSIYIFVHAE